MALQRLGLTMANRNLSANGTEKRQVILDAAVKVFAERGFHGCRVSDIAKSADVAYGLVYHYFDSKEEILNAIFSERWSIMLDRITEIDTQDVGPRQKLTDIASFIIDSYRYDPDVMKVIIVEVTRAANSFGRAHLEEIEQAYRGIEAIVARGQGDGIFKDQVPAKFASLLFYGAIEQLLSGWIFETLPRGDAEFEQAKELVVETICSGLETGQSARVNGL